MLVGVCVRAYPRHIEWKKKLSFCLQMLSIFLFPFSNWWGCHWEDRRHWDFLNLFIKHWGVGRNLMNRFKKSIQWPEILRRFNMLFVVLGVTNYPHHWKCKLLQMYMYGSCQCRGNSLLLWKIHQLWFSSSLVNICYCICIIICLLDLHSKWLCT